MRRNLFWLVISSLVVLAMLLAACAPTTTTTTQQPTTTTQQPTVTTTTTTTTQQPTTTTTETKTTEAVSGLAPEVPRYGGTITLVEAADPVGFDEMFIQKPYAVDYYLDALITGDWGKGPAGTNEYDWSRSGVVRNPAYMMGGLAESWDLPDPKTLIFNIRKGVHYGLNPDSEASRLVNGRELTADDIVKTWERWYTNPAGYLSLEIPRAEITDLYAPDKYTVVVRWTSNPAPGREFGARRGWAFQLYNYMRAGYPREIVEKYGSFKDWRNAVGTGPFFLVDYVAGSMITFKRNPNYWRFDPIHPENRLPYVETARTAIIPDMATRLAALRTGKIDHLRDILYEDAQSLIKTNPELKYKEFLTSTAGTIAFRVDKPEQPWYKQEVRQALTMAIDYAGIVKNYYQGKAAYPAYPITPFPDYFESGAYIPLDKLPADIQELFSYNPTRAKQMLADAGYPNGFKASVIITADLTDLAEMAAAYWRAVGVDLEIQVKERAVYASIQTMGTHPELLMTSVSGSQPYSLMAYLPGDWHNYSKYTGPEMSAKALEMDEVYFDVPAMGKLFADFSPHLYRLALYVGLPTTYRYAFWQPWVLNYHGEWQVGNNSDKFDRFVWIDQDLKKQMTGR
ncbi:MAG: ABC transporter substrate-binding protein [Chloroflexi bacterium]|nr:ABC transporter substrate-binding protein [Chloroflexota bacterium]